MRLTEFINKKIDLEKEKEKSSKILKSWYDSWNTLPGNKPDREEYVNQRFLEYINQND